MPAIDVAQQKVIAADLVIRARQFDQNAIGMLDAIRKSALAGSPAAKSAMVIIKAYIAANPVANNPNVGFGQDPSRIAKADYVLGVLKDRGNALEDKCIVLTKLPSVAVNEDVCGACVILCCCAPLRKAEIAQAAQNVFGGKPPVLRAFQYGFEHPTVKRGSVPPRLLPAAFAGHVFGTAHRMQGVRARKAPPGILNNDIQNELG